jgi:DNA invertase Pin-like site-specific DNA recombinase
LIRNPQTSNTGMSPPKIIRAAAYHRVSRSDQNPQLQQDEVAELVERRGWSLAKSYTDEGISGSRDRRPELDQLLADARRRKYDLLVVWRADRLFRSLRHMVVTLDELAALGVGFVSVTEPFDTSTPSGKLLLHLVSAMAEFERSILIERTKAGLAAAIRRGVKVGRPRVEIDVERAKVLRAEGKTFRQVAGELGVGAATLHRALSNGAAIAAGE